MLLAGVALSGADAAGATGSCGSRVGGCTNRAPRISGRPPRVATVGQSYGFLPTATDADGNTLHFDIVNKPDWANFSPSSGKLWGKPGAAAAGTYANVTISVSDGRATATLAPFSIAVTPPNRAPLIRGTASAAVMAGQSYGFQPAASDADGDRLTFSIANQPPWANFSSSSGKLWGKPGAAHAGTYDNIVISVSDGQARAMLAPFSIRVAAPNRAPVISGTPAGSVTTGQGYAFQPGAADADGNRLSFTIVNRPPWATFSSSTGRLAGTPDSAAVGEYIDVRISVSDGQASAVLAPFSIVVSQPNRAPAIGGTSATAIVESQGYSFQPLASDADGDTLSFSIANQPAWASFSTTTGKLSGTPAAGTAGTYSSITISVSDGQSKVSLPAFAITVQQVATGSATLSWQPPTTRSDGTPLTNLAGYRIRYGTTAGSYPNLVQIANPGLTSAVIENLAQGTWYFVATAYDSTGAESDFSSVVAKTVN